MNVLNLNSIINHSEMIQNGDGPIIELRFTTLYKYIMYVLQNNFLNFFVRWPSCFETKKTIRSSTLSVVSDTQFYLICIVVYTIPKGERVKGKNSQHFL